MINDKKGFNKHEFIGMLFNRFFWFMVIFGILEIFLFKRVVGWFILTGGIICLLSYYAKINKWGPFKPQPKVSQKAVGSLPLKYLGIVRVFVLIFVLLFAFSAIYFGWKLHSQVNEKIDKECKMCSVFQKDCPYTTEEMAEQEWSNGPCGDMGSYELMWKGTMMIVLVGFIFLGLAITTLINFFWDIPWLKKITIETQPSVVN